MRNAMEKTKLISADEFAARLGISKQTVYNWLNLKKCPVRPKRVGRLVRFRENEVEEFLAK
jgi:excisionase family DNA binding protein